MRHDTMKSLFVFCFLTLLCIVNGVGAQETVVYSEGFEDDNGGYSLAYGTAEWEWGSPTGSVGPAAAHSGTSCWATDLDNTLDRTATDGSILSPPIGLPSLDPGQILRVRFWAWIAVDGMYDRGEFSISQDGVNWTSICEFFQSMDPEAATAPAWRRYEFSIPNSYAGGDVYLRFRAYVPSSQTYFYCGGSNDLSGFYIDDIAITVYNVDVPQKVLTLEAWEDAYSAASCPWIVPWNGSSFEADNDIYSVARFAENEFVDYYKLMLPLVEADGVYPLEIQEREMEDSFTDFVALLQVDHAADVAVAPDQDGQLVSYTPAALVPPVSAVTDEGEDVLALIETRNDVGAGAYHDDTVTVDFGDVDISGGARLLIRVAGFIRGDGVWGPYVGPPAIVVETLDSAGQWQERGRLRPRFQWSEQAFNLSPYLSNGAARTVRLRSISHATKYHSIDFAALDTGAAPEYQVTYTEPSLALFGEESVLAALIENDNSYMELNPGETAYVEFPVAPLASDSVREFVFVSKGYYNPLSGTYLIYTWDGTSWVLRDGRSYPGSDATNTFDLSLFLPDPDGEYKVRIWQDYQWSGAGIDYTAMSVAGSPAPLLSAWDQRNASSCYSQLVASDNIKTNWTNCPRDRIVDLNFDGPANFPPTTDPVTVDVQSALLQIISWTYQDPEDDAQAKYEVEVWSGADGSGDNVWDPAIGVGDASSVEYAGDPLTCETDYYARVRAQDGESWGPWSEAVFQTPCNQPPMAVCQDIEVSLDEIGEATISAEDVDGGCFDPDGDDIELGIDRTDFSCDDTGQHIVTLTVTDEHDASDACEATVTVLDTTPPEVMCNAPSTIIPPDAPITFTAGATDNCDAGVEIVGYDCWAINGAGKRISKLESCVVSFEGDSLTIDDSGGVGDNIEWIVVATDASGNTTELTCSLEVVRKSKP